MLKELARGDDCSCKTLDYLEVGIKDAGAYILGAFNKLYIAWTANH
jgi:hypothetical protein